MNGNAYRHPHRVDDSVDDPRDAQRSLLRRMAIVSATVPSESAQSQSRWVTIQGLSRICLKFSSHFLMICLNKLEKINA